MLLAVKHKNCQKVIRCTSVGEFFMIPLDSNWYSAFAANKCSFASRNWNVELDKACFMKPILTFTALIYVVLHVSAIFHKLLVK